MPLSKFCTLFPAFFVFAIWCNTFHKVVNRNKCWYSGNQKLYILKSQVLTINMSHIYFSTGTPLIGRFLGPRINRLSRKPSYWLCLYGINLHIGDLRNQKSPLFLQFFIIFQSFKIQNLVNRILKQQFWNYRTVMCMCLKS